MTPCVGKSNAYVLCGRVVVPLDPTGKVAGTVTLHVEELPNSPAGNRTSKVMVLLAGGPGQAATAAFELRHYGDVWRHLFPGYTIVAYDDRGTGRSSPISCPGLRGAEVAPVEAAITLIGACSRNLGARRSFYTTRANASDLEAIRAALGVDRIAIYGVSYGTRHAIEYAYRYPEHVERLILDSTTLPSWPDPYEAETLRVVPATLKSLCTTHCPTSALGREFVTLANRLQTSPVRAVVPRPGRGPAHVRLDGYVLLGLGVAVDLAPTLMSELPAAVHVALAGEMQPLLRLAALAMPATTVSAYDVSETVFIATTCNDGMFPWGSETSQSRRDALLVQSVRRLAAGVAGPFGEWAPLSGPARACEQWPGTGEDPTLPAGKGPSVPVLILSGSRDMRTPTSNARSVARLFARSRVVVVPGVGHAVAGSAPCAARIITAWLRGNRTGPCVPVPSVPTLESFPVLPPHEGALTAEETLTIAVATMREAAAISLIADRYSLSGLVAGSLRALFGGEARLVEYADVPGVSLTGFIGAPVLDGAGRWAGKLKVSGGRAAAGVLTLEGHTVSGTLGGVDVSMRIPPA